AQRTTWLKNLGLGLTSGLLNPKNALFYVSLAAAVRAAAPLTLVLYGIWMFCVVLVWDVFVAVGLGSRRAMAHLDRVLPWLTRLSGGFIVLFGGGMVVALTVEFLSLRVGDPAPSLAQMRARWRRSSSLSRSKKRRSRSAYCCRHARRRTLR